MIYKNWVLIGKLLLVVCVVAAQVSCATAKSGQRDAVAFKRKSANDIMSELAPRLKLTEEQKARVLPIIQSFSDKRNEIIGSKQSWKMRDSIKEDMASLHKDTEKLLAMVLTDEQMKEYQKYQSDERQKMEDTKQSRRSDGMRRGRGGEMRGGDFGMPGPGFGH